MNPLLPVTLSAADLFWPANVLIQVTVVSVAAIAFGALVKRRSAVRHAVLATALICLSSCPLTTWLLHGAGWTTFALSDSDRDGRSGTVQTPVPATPASRATIRQTPPNDELTLFETDPNRLALNSSAPASVQKTASRIGDTTSVGTAQGSPLFQLNDPLSIAVSVSILVWLIGALVFIARIVHGLLAVRKILACAVPIDSSQLHELSARLRMTLGLNREPPILVIDSAGSPVVVGLFRPAIVLPRRLLDRLTSDQLLAVLIHETAHLARRDHLLALLQRLVEAAYWPHPLVHILNHMLSRSREEVCDNYVLRNGDSRGYADLLLHLAQSQQPMRELAGQLAIISPRWSLRDRIVGLFDQRRGLGVRAPRLVLAAFALSFGAAAAFIAGIRPVSAGNQTDVVDALQPAGKAVPHKVVEAAEKPLHADPKMAEIIRHVLENEARYNNLETVVRSVEIPVTDEKSPWSARQVVATRRSVIQGELLFLQRVSERTLLNDAIERNEIISAYDGDKTRTVNGGNSANIHLDRHESQYVYPPHSWVLFAERINFPLSVFLRGADAIQSHPKLHRSRFPQGGTLYEFPRVEASFEKEEMVNGLKCLKIRVLQWHSLQEGPWTHFLWLAPDRNYLCVKSQVLWIGNELPHFDSTVDAFREIANGMWLPTKITAKRNDPDQLSKGKTLLQWLTTLTLEDTVLKPGHPASFFRDIKIPDDLPVYTIKDGRLVGTSGFEYRAVDSNSAARVKEIIEKVRENERLYADMDVVVEKNYRLFEEGFSGRGSFPAMKTIGRAAVRQGKGEGSGETTAELVEGGSRQLKDWRFMYRPHRMLFEAYVRNASQQTLSDDLASNTQTVSWLGEDQRDGFRCDVLRLERTARPGAKPAARIFGLVWLAKERNYLPIRREVYNEALSDLIPLLGVKTASDLREIRPGVWFPFRVLELQHRARAIADLTSGDVIIETRSETVVQKAVLRP